MNRRESIKSTKLFQVGLLGPGDSFADFELLNNKAIIDSVVTMVPTVIFYVPYFMVVERLTPDDLERLREFSKSKVKSSVVLQSFKENDMWIDFKKKLVQHLRYEKEQRVHKSGITNKSTISKVDIDAKTRDLFRAVKPPAKIGMRSINYSESGSSGSYLPPLRKSVAKINKD